MGEQDSTEKGMEDCNGVFADIVKGFLFYGKETISKLLADSTECYPVISKVLHFGRKRRRRPHSLLECFKVPQCLKPYADMDLSIPEIAGTVMVSEEVQKILENQ